MIMQLLSSALVVIILVSVALFMSLVVDRIRVALLLKKLRKNGFADGNLTFKDYQKMKLVILEQDIKEYFNLIKNPTNIEVDKKK